jgi:hypothetical protein
VILRLPMRFLMAQHTEGDQILGRVIAEAASWLNVMDLKIFHASAPLASPAIPLQHFAAQQVISFRIKPQAGPFG